MKASTGGLTRREIGLGLVAASASVMAQPPAAEDLNALARDQVQSNIEALRQFKIPMATEPSFNFRP